MYKLFYQTEMEWKTTDHHKIMINFITHIIKLFVFHVAKTIFYRLMEIISDNLEWIEMQKNNNNKKIPILIISQHI